MRLAVVKGWRDDDPTEGLKKIRYREQEIHSWSPTETAAFERHWPVGTRAHLAYALMLYTAQRKSDVVKLGPRDIDADGLHVVQQKTGVELWIPLHPELKKVLEKSEIGARTFLVTAEGNPMPVAGFSNWFRKCVADASLPKQCTPHGLRKAACMRLAEIGCTPHQIMAISGHKTLAEVERYTRKFDKKRLGANTMRMWASAGKVKE